MHQLSYLGGPTLYARNKLHKPMEVLTINSSPMYRNSQFHLHSLHIFSIGFREHFPGKPWMIWKWENRGFPWLSGEDFPNKTHPLIFALVAFHWHFKPSKKISIHGLIKKKKHVNSDDETFQIWLPSGNDCYIAIEMAKSKHLMFPWKMVDLSIIFFSYVF